MMTPAKGALIAKIGGSLLIFASWVVQSQFQAEWQAEREELDRLRQRIVANDTLANIWYAAYTAQIARAEIDLIPTATMGLQYINFSHQVRSSALRWLRMRDSPFLQESGALVQAADLARIDGDHGMILDFTARARQLDETVVGVLTMNMELHYEEVREKEDSWGGRFILTYVLGATFIAVGFVLTEFGGTRAG